MDNTNKKYSSPHDYPTNAVSASFDERPEIGYTWKRGDFTYRVIDTPNKPGSCMAVAVATYNK